MSDKKQIEDISNNVKVVKKVYPQVYSYTLPEFPEEDGWQKIGYTERIDVDERIREQTSTPAKTLKYNKLWNRPAKYFYKEGWFTDKHFHRFLQQNGIQRSTDNKSVNIDGTEKFYFNGTPEKSIELFNDFTSNCSINASSREPYKLRPEQQEAVDMTVDYSLGNQTIDFENPNPKANFLWNAKPRFGKTLTAYDFVKNFVNSSTGQKGAKSVLIMTNRPAIADSWFNDYKKFIDGYYFISTVKSVKQQAFTHEEFECIQDENKRKIVFLSLQDFKGSKIFGGKFDKLGWVYKEKWDLLIIDEAHEGVDTDKMTDAAAKLKKRFTLHLSGTPFRQLADRRYSKEQIYNWTYLDEQKAKQDELERGEESGAHTDMPDLRFFAYEMSQVMLDTINQGVEIDGEKVAFAYDGLNDFFAARNGKFIHETDVRRFLDLLTQNTKYPFSTPELRDELKHTFWWVGNRVESVKAMESLLADHPVFRDYKVVSVVGKGSAGSDDYEEESSNEKDNRESLAKVRDAIEKHDKTITLSVGQLTTGVTVKEWSAVLMMNDTKSNTQYTQAIFRAQNPYSYVKNGECFHKKSAYVFDFALVRILETYDELANNLVSERVRGELTGEDRHENNRELLNYMPVIAQDEYGEMVQLDASQVLTFPKAAKAKEIVDRQFISNYLFANGLNVFRIPTAVRARINKMEDTKDDGKRARGKDVDTINTSNQKAAQRQERKTRNTRAMLGDKIYGNEIDEVVAAALQFGVNQNATPSVVKGMMEDVLAEPIAKWVETYNVRKSEAKERLAEIEKKVYEIAESYISPAMSNQDKNDLVNSLSDFVLEELPKDTVGNSEDALGQKEEEDENNILIRKLKTFTRAIPILVMASDNPEELTLHNIETAVDEETFMELFTERHGGGESLHQPFTVEDFKMLRDGGVFTEPDGEVVEFGGCFDTYSVNAAIKEFIKKRKEVANYLEYGAKEDIFSYIAPQKSNQIFTPRKVVNQMLNILEQENPGIFSNPHITFCDLYIKSGLYLTEIAKRLHRGLADIIPDETVRIKHIFENQLYGFTPSKVIDAVARGFIYGVAGGLSDKNLIQKDLTEDFKSGRELDMKFDVVIGNPPYQDKIKGRSEQPPIYHHFIDGAYKVSDKVYLITPARFLFNVGGTPKTWNEKMLDDKHLKVAFFEQKSDNVFPGTDIKGGVAITYRDKSSDFGKIGTFTHFDQLNSITKKVLPKADNMLADIYFSNTAYKYSPLFFKENPGFESRVSGGSKRYMASSAFDKFPEAFSENPESDNHVKIIGRRNNQRTILFFNKKYINPPENFCKFKVLLPGSNGSGAIGEVLSTPLVGEPLVGHTETFISFGAFEVREEAENCMKYIKTRFARTMLGVRKVTQGNKNAYVWGLVPLQNFTANSDIDWSQSIPEIDRQLYKKYGLDEKEIAFIEEKVCEME